ncbi:MAG: T9SS type A sorting domain-containing protein, partial [Saprospiraceae bacterium]
MPPHLDAPATDILIQCSLSDQETAIQDWLDIHGGMEVTNFCGDVVWSHDFSGLNDGCGASGSTDVTFTATDGCGYIESNATLTIEDTQAPVITTHASDLVVESDGNGNISQINSWLLNRGGAQVSDACSDVSWTHNFNGLSDGCGGTGYATVQFTALDACGNSVVTSATFTILDRIAPDIYTLASDTILECGSGNPEAAIQEWLNNNGGANATDLNGIISWSHNYSGLSDGCGFTGNATVIFTASDVCGNIKSTTASVSVGDSIGLQMSVLPQDTMIDCGDGNAPAIIQSWLDDHGGARVNDQCGDVIWFNSFPGIPDTCSAPGIIVVSFTVVDDCGQFLSAQAMLTILDSLETSVADFDDVDFRIFPNPVSEMLTIDLSKKDLGTTNLTLFDTFGKAVWSSGEKAKQNVIPVMNFPPGVYFLLIQSSPGSHSQKVIIN